MFVASTLLAVLICGAFAVLLVAVEGQRDAARLAHQSQLVLSTANQLERLTVDLETGERGYLLTGDQQFLAPWKNARAAFPGAARALVLLSQNSAQHKQALRIEQAGKSYIQDYSVPIVDSARRGDPAARSPSAVAEGKRRVDAIRADFERLDSAEQELADARENSWHAAAQRAVISAVVGVAGSVILVALFTGYLSRSIVGPIRRAAVMSGRLAGGDLTARMPETGIGEIGALERAFNIMGGSLQRSRAQLAASRRRIAEATDRTRRTIERDLHDGTQQRLVSLSLDLRAIEEKASADLRGEVAAVATGLDDALEELRELARGIHPAILTEGGLVPALRALARRSAVPVELAAVRGPRLAQRIEVAAYYVVAEALTNAAKHAQASAIQVTVSADDRLLRLSVADDGIGGADQARGTGLIGLIDRVEALDGTITVTSPAGAGTVLRVELPAETG
ncbi:MAG TPA: CHASE3 domain-containing protein [Mycobacteriales bacterium]|nr:CHASE3 domain-containing protein [Mycobacteriales bacterium]